MPLQGSRGFLRVSVCKIQPKEQTITSHQSKLVP